MISKLYICNGADCENFAEFTSKKAARADGWAIARDNKTCYCPSCAPRYRNVGQCGTPRRNLDKQLKII